MSGCTTRNRNNKAYKDNRFHLHTLSMCHPLQFRGLQCKSSPSLTSSTGTNSTLCTMRMSRAYPMRAHANRFRHCSLAKCVELDHGWGVAQSPKVLDTDRNHQIVTNGQRLPEPEALISKRLSTQLQFSHIATTWVVNLHSTEPPARHPSIQMQQWECNCHANPSRHCLEVTICPCLNFLAQELF